jgi:DNA (cytosine-5)-methyltransferase 1
MAPLSYISLCAGIDAASVAWGPLGFRLKAVAEIEPFPCAVLAERQGASRPEYMPQVELGDSAEVVAGKLAAIRAVAKLDAVGKIPNRGDFTTITGDEYGAVDLVVAGTPCQDFSVAGLRAGMDGKRGQLTVEFAKLAHRMAAKARTRWIVWENVPGVLSIDEGWAFAEFLGILAKRPVRVPDGGWSNFGIIPGAADGFGLVYRICDAQFFGVPQRRRRVFVVGYSGDWRRAAAVLLERHSLSGDTPPRRQKGQVAPTIPSRSLGGGGLGTDFDCDGGLIKVAPIAWQPEQSPTLRGGASGTNQVPAVAIQNATRGKEQNGLGISDDGSMYTLDQGSQHGVAIALSGRARGDDGRGYERPEHTSLEIAGTLDGVKVDRVFGLSAMAVRRLTPKECERLQGFPDDYTKISDKTADGPRYKALGNSMAVPVMRWIGERIQMVESLVQA